jgi:hypothetical protein
MIRRPGLAPGMVVSVPKGPVTHVGIVSRRLLGGMPKVFASSPRTYGAAEVTWWEFGDNQPITVQGYLGDLPPGEVLWRAEALVGQLPYDAGSQNCEHYVTRSLGYKPFSPTVQRLVTCGLIVFVALAVAKAA